MLGGFDDARLGGMGRRGDLRRGGREEDRLEGGDLGCGGEDRGECVERARVFAEGGSARRGPLGLGAVLEDVDVAVGVDGHRDGA